MAYRVGYNSWKTAANASARTRRRSNDHSTPRVRYIFSHFSAVGARGDWRVASIAMRAIY